LDHAEVPFGQVAALQYDSEEADKVQALLSAQSQYGCNVGDDVFVLPGNGDYLLQADHHEVIWVSFREERLIEPLVRHMTAGGYALPSEAPDERFKPQDWLG